VKVTNSTLSIRAKKFDELYKAKEKGNSRDEKSKPDPEITLLM
jgi:hypothetical protein